MEASSFVGSIGSGMKAHSRTELKIPTDHASLRKFAKDGRFLHFLNAVLQDNQCLSKIAKQSYRHFNGFDKIVLLSDSESGQELRVHIWWPKIKPTNLENIHDHKWDFSSVILQGEYDYEIYDTSGSGRVMSEFVFRGREGGSFSQVPYVGTASLKIIEAGCFGKGYCYSMKNNVLHRIRSNHRLTTVTLVSQGPEIAKSARVFSEPGVNRPTVIRSGPLSVEETSSKLNFVKSIAREWATT